MSNLEVGVRLTADGRGLVNAVDSARDSFNNMGRDVLSVNSVLKTMAAGLAGLSIAKHVKEAATLSQRYQELGIILDVAGRNAGISAGELDKTTEAVRKSGITMLQSRQAVTSMIQANIDLSEATKLARLAQDAAVVGQLNSSEALDRLIYGLSTAQIEVLKTMGLTVNFERAYKNMATQLGKTTDELTDQERMQARLNTVYESGKNIVGAYEGAMNNAGKQYRSTQRQVEDLKVVVGGLFDETSKLAVAAYTDVLKTLTSEVDTLTSNGDIVRWGDNIALTFAVAGDAARAAFSPILILLKTVDSAIARGSALVSGDFAKSRQIGADFDKFLKSEIDVLTGSTKLQDALQKQLVARDLLTAAVGRGAKALQTATAGLDANTGSSAKNAAALKKEAAERKKIADAAEREYRQRVDSSVRFIVSTARETEEIGKNAIQKRMLAAATEAANAPTKELAQEIMASAQAWAMATQAQDEALSNNRQMADAAAARQRAETQAAQAVQQEWNQTWSTVESTARISFTQFAAHGVGAMEAIGKSIQNGIIDLLYQLTVRKWIINVGASIGLAGGAGLALASGGTGGGIDSALNIASLGSGALNLFKGGFGATSALSSIGNMIPGSAGAFLSGIGGNVIPGVSSPAALSGASFGSFAGPAVAAAAVDMALRGLFGDKKLGGTAGDVLSYVPIVGTLINGLFGRGAPKFQGESLVGNVSASGFDGVLNQAYREKGGLARSDRTSNFIVDADSGNLLNQFGRLSESGNIPGGLRDSVTGPAVKRALEVGDLLDEAFGAIGNSLKQTADMLGLSTGALDGFKAELDLVSEKGKTITEQQVSDEIARISNEMAQSLIPNLDEFAKKGESAIDTVSRLGAQFGVLTDAVSVVFGQSGQAAKDIVNRFSIGDQTAFIDAAGGVENLGQKINQFFGNLDDSDKLTILEDRLKTALDAVGVNFIPTMEQFNDAMRSAAITPQLFIEGLNLQGLIKEVNDLRTALTPAAEITGKTADVTDDAAKKELDLIKAREGAARAADKAARREAQQKEIDAQEAKKQRSIEFDIRAADERAAKEKELLKLRFDNERAALEETRKRSQEITSFIESLRRSAFDVSPLGFQESGNIIASAIKDVASGADFQSIITERVQAAIRGSGNIDERLFSSFDELARARGEAASRINELAALGENQLTTEGATLAELEKQTALLQKTFDVLNRRIDAGAEFDKSLAGQSVSGQFLTSGGTARRAAIQAAQRQIFILENDLEQDPRAMLQARLQLIRASATPESVYGGGKLTQDITDMIKQLQLVAIEQARMNGFFKRVMGDGDALNVRTV